MQSATGDLVQRDEKGNDAAAVGAEPAKHASTDPFTGLEHASTALILFRP